MCICRLGVKNCEYFVLKMTRIADTFLNRHTPHICTYTHRHTNITHAMYCTYTTHTAHTPSLSSLSLSLLSHTQLPLNPLSDVRNYLFREIVTATVSGGEFTVTTILHTHTQHVRSWQLSTHTCVCTYMYM